MFAAGFSYEAYLLQATAFRSVTAGQGNCDISVPSSANLTLNMGQSIRKLKRIFSYSRLIIPKVAFNMIAQLFRYYF